MEKAVKVFFNTRRLEARLALQEQLEAHSKRHSSSVDFEYCEMLKAQLEALKALV
jgi:hypothetical protein